MFNTFHITGKIIKQKTEIQDGTEEENTIWGQSRQYKRRRNAEIQVAHLMNHHIRAAAGGGPHQVVRGGRRPPHIMWTAGIVTICLRMFFLLLPNIVFSAWARYCAVFLGRLGPKLHVFFSLPSLFLRDFGETHQLRLMDVIKQHFGVWALGF